MRDHGLFGPGSVTWRIHAHRSLLIGGLRALLVQALEPRAMAAVDQHSSFRRDPWARLRRTSDYLITTTFGDTAAAQAAGARVRKVHALVRGVDPVTGRPYRADDPELLLWILACLVDSALLVYGRYVRPLSRDERDRYWQEYKLIGNLFALRDEDMPESIEDFDAYMADMLAGDVLHVGDEVRRLAVQIVMNPTVPLPALPLLKGANFATIGLLPERLRRAYGFSWDPVRSVALHGGAEYIRRILVPVLPERFRMIPLARAA